MELVGYEDVEAGSSPLFKRKIVTDDIEVGTDMIQYKDECVGCPDGMGCLGDACPYGKMPITYCDNCGQEDVLYTFPDTDEQLCENCMNSELDELWAGLTFQEKCEIFDVKEVKI